MPEISESEAKEMEEKLTTIKQEVSSDNTQLESQRPHQKFTIGSVAQPSTLKKMEKNAYISSEKKATTVKAWRSLSS
jgi:hypothetical protein